MRNKLIILIIMISSLCLYTQDYPKHSTGIDFGTTLFSTVTLPLISDTVFKPKEGAAGKVLDGKYGIRLTYNYAYLPTQALDLSIGVYGFDTHYGDNEPVKKPTAAFDTASPNATVIATFVAFVLLPPWACSLVSIILILFIFVTIVFFKPFWLKPNAEYSY